MTSTMTSMRVLVVEDESIVAEDIRDQLTKMGSTVVGPVSSGEQAVLVAERDRPDVVLMDIRLQGRVDGVEAADRIRQKCHIPVVYLTAHSDDDTLERAKRTQPQGYLLKPFAENDLRVNLELALSKHALEQRTRQQQQSQEQLHWLQRFEAIGRLAGGMAHEINNMLTVVLGCGELLLTQLGPGHALAATLESMLAAGDRTASLTKQLLAFSRKQVLCPGPLNLNKALQRMQPMFARLLGPNIEVALELEPQLHAVCVDRMQWEQVVINLAINARDAMPAGGTLGFTTRNVVLDEAFAGSHPAVVPGPYVLLAVHDTGCGMDSHTREHLFEPFFTTKEFGKGTGLGLATVYGIVTQSGGHIFVDSLMGEGTTFSVYLPRADRPTAAASPNPALTTPALPKGTETILLVEDEECVRNYIAQMIRQLGYTVVVAEHGQQALELAARHDGPVHLLLTDVVMPHLNGAELARRLAEKHPGIKVLYMSGYLDVNSFPTELLDENVVLLQKPFTASALACKMRLRLDG